jgi:hypothetical protein
MGFIEALLFTLNFPEQDNWRGEEKEEENKSFF